MKQRKSIRFLLLNSKNELLLMRVVDPTTTGIDGKSRDAFWCTPGGSVEPDETDCETIARELYEETGLSLDNDVKIGPYVWYGKHVMFIRGQKTAMNEKFIVLHALKESLNTDNFTEEEKKVITHLEWLSFDQILHHEEPIFPVILKTHLAQIIAGEYPTEPVEVDLSLLPEKNHGGGGEN